MNPEHSKLRHQQQAEQQSDLQQTQAQAREFATVEELLRHDSEQNPVTPEVAERVNRSIAAEPTRKQPWYKRLFGD